MRFSISALVLLFSVQIEAATWYVDFSAGNDANVGSVGSPLKRSPGMTGFTGSATLAAGDVVMFNGGVVWPSNCFPLAPTSGTVGSPITYTSYGTGRPRFNGGTNWPGGTVYMIYSGGTTKYINYSNLQFEHLGTDGVAPAPSGCLHIVNPIDVTVSNCVFAPQASHGILVAHYASLVPAGNLLIVSNDFTKLANALEIGRGAAAADLYGFTNITITGNHFHDFTLWNTDHGDGIHLFNHNAITNVLINLNRWDGSFAGDDPVNVTANTGFIYFEAEPNDAQIINNVFAPQDISAPYNNTYIVSPGMIVGSATNWLIANNTFYGSSIAIEGLRPKSAIALGLPRELGITNNIFYDFPYGILAIYAGSEPGVDWFSDYNVYYSCTVPVMWTATYQYLISQAFAAWGIEGNSTTNRPTFSGGAGDFRPVVGDTAAIGRGANLNSLFTTDIVGTTRGATWDIGAYEYIPTNVPAAGTAQISGNVQITGDIVLTVSLGTAVTNPPVNTNIWAQRFGSTSTDTCRAIVSDASSGNIIMGGGFSGTVNFGTGALVSAGGIDMYLAGYNSSGTALWSKRYGGTGSEVVRGVALDGSGNVYVCGHFLGASDFGGGVTNSTGINDIFIAKYSSTGVYQWVKTFGNTDDDVAESLDVDSGGNVIVTGYFKGQVNFGGGILFSQFSGMDTFLAKYSTAGAFVFAKKFTNTADDDGIGVSVDASDNIILTGKFQGSIDMGGGSVASAGATDMYLAKFDSAGTHTWSDTFGGAFPDFPTGVSVDNSGNIYLLGSFTQIINMGGGNLTTGSSDSDAVLAKYNSGGTYQWASAFAGPGYESPRLIDADDSGNSVITGSFQYTINLGGGVLTSASVGVTDAFVAKYNTSGTCLWSYRGGGVGADDGLAVGIDGSGYVAAGGSFSGNAGFGSTIFGSAGGTDIFLWKLAP